MNAVQRGAARGAACDAFIAGHDLPQRWRGRERFVMLATAFGSGELFLAAWQAWRDDPQRCTQLVFIALEPQPTVAEEWPPVIAASASPGLAEALRQALPPSTANLHRLGFEAGRVELLLALGDAARWWRELAADVDAFCLDAAKPIEEPRRAKAIGRLAAPGASLVDCSMSKALHEHLVSAGFVWLPTPNPAGFRRARFAPTFAARNPATRLVASPTSERHALIIGAGLAGCAAAWALSEQGWRSTLLERRTHIAGEASGNPAGLFHGIVHAQDGLHARFHRAAALMAHAAVRMALQRSAAGAVDGLLRLETRLDARHMRQLLILLGLPSGYVQALDAAEAGARAGLAMAHPAWFYPTGGWVDPGGLARAFVEESGSRTELRPGVEVARLERHDERWRLLDAHGALIAEAGTVVVASAGDAMRLIDLPELTQAVSSVRGQISIAAAAHLPSPHLPIAGSGYLLPAVDGRVMFGATAQVGDADPAVRETDHALNLRQIEGLLGRDVGLLPADLEGRTAWRCSAEDRLPLIGAVPVSGASGTRLEQPRFVPRQPGLFVYTALGSRGITWSALGARLLAAWVTGAPMPIEASLRDAVDPARFVSRRLRRASRG